MRTSRSTTMILLITTGLAVPCRAQLTPGMAQQIFPYTAQGLFSNLPVGLTVDEPGEGSWWWVRAPGTNSGVPVEWSSAHFGTATLTHPDFSLEALTAHWRPSGLTPSFGGVSTGGEVMPRVDSGGQMIMTPSNWYMLAVSVDPLAQGVPGSLLRSRTTGGRNPAGDLLSYYAVGSTGIHPAFVDTARLEYSREQLALQQAGPATATPREIANHDFGLGVISIDPQNRAGNMFPVRNCFYFTLTQAWVLDATQAFPAFQLGGFPPSWSTIYVMTWSDTPSLGWSEPQIAFSHAELFPGCPLGTVEIDALSVDKGQGSPLYPDRAVFSLTPASDWGGAFDQILVHQRAPTACATTALMTDGAFETSTKVSTKLGLRPRPAEGIGEPDDVRSTCGGDPIEGFTIGPVMGLATPEHRQGDGELGLTAVRRSTAVQGAPDGTATSMDTLHIQVTGLDHAPHMLGFVVLYLEGPPVPVGGIPAAPQQLGEPIWIDPASSARNALDISVSVPAKAGATASRFSARCFGLDFTSAWTITPLRESWVLSIRL
ncbi:MAG: hypothetical protein JNK02_07000 [Planctomycetes bacterium]|nr:hypothetical protein [Planctomycetota bacterium]